jgi:hypothetical protein
LKKTSLGPLRQGQRLDTSERKPCSSKENKQPKHARAHPAHMQTLGTNRSGRFHQNRSDRFPKPVRLIWYSRPHPPKDKNAKEMHKPPLESWDRF